jgi:ABC-type transport system involved in multi-copper enzyme maturation permease subunit
MFTTIVAKELRAIVLSPKFGVTFGVCSLLILLAVFTGIQEYRAAEKGWETAVRLADDQAREAVNWHHFSYKTLRRPDPLAVFVSGLSSDIGRWSEISQQHAVKLRHSPFSDDPIYAVFRMVDFAFIVQIVLSLLAILFTYDAVSGERESGTLKLIFANGVPRATYLLAKSTGAWLGLVVPIVIPILLGVLLVMLYGIPLTTLHVLKLATLVGVSLLFFTFFIVLGVLISTLTRRSSVSFLVALVVWVAFVLIIPRVGMMAAGQMVHVPRVAEIEAQRDGFAKDVWRAHYEGMEERYRESHSRRDEPGYDEDQAMWDQMQREDSLRQVVEMQIEAYETRLLNDLRRRKATQERLAFTLSRISPASSYQLAAMTLAGTNIDLKSRYEEAMSAYREDFSEYVQARDAETENQGGFVQIEISSEDGLKIGTGRDEPIDVAGMPRFQPPVVRFAQVLVPIIPDLGILSVATLLAFLGAFAAFLRCDVR